MAGSHSLFVVLICGGMILDGASAPVGDMTTTSGGVTDNEDLSAGSTVDDNTDVDINVAMAYLAQYKYIEDTKVEDTAGQKASLHDPTEALKNLQHMAGLAETGILDEATKEVIKLPRCGVSDNSIDQNVRRRKRYTIEGSRWRGTNIRYKVSQYSRDMSESVIDDQIKKAFDTWATYTPLNFIKVPAYQKADIEIRFTKYSHGDPFPFDGPGRTLAHAFFPRYGGDIHLDDSDTFTANRYGGVDLLQVVTHELGHSLGLSHSSVQSALMAPFYRGYNPNLRLDPDDIRGIQGIYGRKFYSAATTRTTPRRTTTSSTRRQTTRTTTTSTTSSTTTRPTTTTTTTPRPRWPGGKPVTTRVPYYGRNTPAPATPAPVTRNPRTPNPLDGPNSMCHDGRVDAITRFEGKTWMFKGSQFVELDFGGIVNRYPQRISDKWQGLPGNLDAALHWPATYYWAVINGRYKRVITGDARTYFFKGNLIWRFDEGKGMRYGYPKRIEDEFPGLPANLDAAFLWSGNSKTYFIKGSYYYRVSNWQRVDPGYPRPLSMWRGLPSKVDAAFQWVNGRTYFFQGPNYFRFNDFHFNIDPEFPRLSAVWWLGCPDASNNKISNLEMHDKSDQFEEIDTITEESDNGEIDTESDSTNQELPELKRKRGSSPTNGGSRSYDHVGPASYILLYFILCLATAIHNVVCLQNN